MARLLLRATAETSAPRIRRKRSLDRVLAEAERLCLKQEVHWLASTMREGRAADPLDGATGTASFTGANAEFRTRLPGGR